MRQRGMPTGALSPPLPKRKTATKGGTNQPGFRTGRFAVLLWVLALVMLACNLPLTPLPPTPTLGFPLAPGGSPSPTYPYPGETPTPTVTPTPWATLSGTLFGTPTATYPAGGQTCDRAAAGYPSIDVTIPDGTVLQPGEAFVKVWRLRNAGTCTWTPDYRVVWVDGPRLGAPSEIPLSAVVPPGGSIDISVPMTAPSEPGTYTSYWMLRNTQGRLFGLEPTGRDPFWVKIVVATPTLTPTATPTATQTPTPNGSTATPTATEVPSPTPGTPTPTPTPSPSPTTTPTTTATPTTTSTPPPEE